MIQEHVNPAAVAAAAAAAATRLNGREPRMADQSECGSGVRCGHAGSDSHRQGLFAGSEHFASEQNLVLHAAPDRMWRDNQSSSRTQDFCFWA
eukprot:NODE_8419_length_1497_cov_2.370073.p1 GENE.NODE_8419_length_1497_cov_2.370073~~NODE_8419_length_1497_cov_2.370073.p1  ORF type:complete len:93 (+),score=11.89 NODE_8419_length_1497_cov_2.370073:713-991(+)